MPAQGGNTATYLVEGYERRGVIVLDDLEARCRAAADGLDGVRYLRSILVPEDEMCFHLFEGPSEEAVREVGALAGLAPLRVVACLVH
jgi:hypothetical protein